MKNLWTAILAVAIIAATFALGFFTGKGRTKPDPDFHTADTTTTVKQDSTPYVSPKPDTSETVRIERIYLPSKPDTVNTVDTVFQYIDLPIERKVYHEDSSYYAVVTGYHASLDTLITWKTTQIKTVTLTTKETEYIYPNSVSATAGTFYSKQTVVPYFGVAGDFGAAKDRLRVRPMVGYSPDGIVAQLEVRFDLIRF